MTSMNFIIHFCQESKQPQFKSAFENAYPLKHKYRLIWSEIPLPSRQKLGGNNDEDSYLVIDFFSTHLSGREATQIRDAVQVAARAVDSTMVPDGLPIEQDEKKHFWKK